MSSKQDQAARTTVLMMLSLQEVFQMKDFSVDNHTFKAADLAALFGDVSADNIHVKYDPSIAPEVATYDSIDDTLYVTFTDARTRDRQSFIIHETTHALCDKMKMPMNVGQSETMAYVAQCQFAHLRTLTNTTDRLHHPGGGPDDEVFKVGWPLAGKLLQGTIKDLNKTDVANMISAVDKHHKYKGKVLFPAHFNGI